MPPDLCLAPFSFGSAMQRTRALGLTMQAAHAARSVCLFDCWLSHPGSCVALCGCLPSSHLAPMHFVAG